MKVEKLNKANEIQNRISELTKAIQWMSTGNEISVMANKQIGSSVPVSQEVKNMLIVQFQKEVDELQKEFEEM